MSTRNAHCLIRVTLLALLAGVLALPLGALAQVPTTAFTYQGRLTDGGSPASGSYDLRFALFEAESGGSQVGSTVVLSNVPVTDGNLTVRLDFGISPFTGEPRWLEMGVRRGDESFTLLPRQVITAVPYSTYALAAGSVAFTNVTGTASPSQLPDTLWKRGGNAGTTAGADFLGTTDDQPLELRVNGQRALRLEPTSGSPNVIGGLAANSVAAGVRGATIGGGGNALQPNTVMDNGGTVAGGADNVAGNDDGTTSDASYATVGGGWTNQAGGAASTLAGGELNGAMGARSAVAGGWGNVASGDYGFVAGGSANVAGGAGSFAAGRRAKANNLGAFVWSDSSAEADFLSTADNQFAVRAQGGVRFVTPKVIAGSAENTVRASEGTVGGGGGTTVDGAYATVGGGSSNRATGQSSTVAGGAANQTSGVNSAIAGGSLNRATADGAAVAGGSSNVASGIYSFVAGGSSNEAIGPGSFAAGHRAKAPMVGQFTWADSSREEDFAPGGMNRFSARATGGVLLVTGFTPSGLWTGVDIPPGEGSWNTLSDRNVKTNVEPIDPRLVLQGVASLPLSRWSYDSQDPSIRHLGPMAQDFAAAFGVGEDERGISIVDADGVALAAIQGLYQVVQAQEARLAALEQRNASLEAQQRELAELRQAVEALKSARAGQTAGSPTMPWEGGFLGSLPLAGGLVLAGLALRSGAMPGSRRRR